jgi:adenosylcobinamide-GDP ribazoletransferase
MSLLALRAAVRLLTILPLRWREREAQLPGAHAVAWFPSVGAGIGAMLFIIAQVPVPALARAALCLVAWVAVTGGLHEDGVIDCADAAFAPVDPGRRASIRKDPHVGAHGVTVAILLMIARFAALAHVNASAVLLAPVVGRWSMALTLSRYSPDPASVVAAAYARNASAVAASVVALLMLAALLAWQRDVRLAVAAIAGIAGALASAHWLANRLGGASGDVHGASGIIAETIVLYALLPS